jgi:hypothetical protein
MKDVVNRLAREIAEAIGAAVAQDPQVEACREKARAAGYEMRVSLETEIGFGAREPSSAVSGEGASSGAGDGEGLPGGMTPNDRRFLRALRIAADSGGQADQPGGQKSAP